MSIQYQFHEMDSDESLTHLAAAFNAHFLHNTITIAEPVGKGSISHARMEEGLHLRVWDFNVHKKFTIKKIPGTAYGEKIFHIAYLLNPEALSVKITGMDQSMQVQAGMNILFVSNDIDIEVEVDIAKGLQALDISFSSTWLENSFEHVAKDYDSFIHHLIHCKAPTIFFESTTTLEDRLLSKVHQSLSGGIQNLLRLKAGAFSLLSDFFSKIERYPLRNPVIKKNLHHDKMMEVEQLLHAHLEKKLPGMDAIARQNALSESSLKRSFKDMFGKGIYEYYLELKMDAAKRMLLKGNSTVNEVALQFNYEKVSSFIDMFKRHHGVSPGSLKKANS